MSKYQKTGVIEHLNRYEGRYGEFPLAIDYHEAMVQVAKADAMFADLPSSVRSKFENDAEKFLAFVQDPENHDEMIDMGLLEPTEADILRRSTPTAGEPTTAETEASEGDPAPSEVSS
jgi:phage internal scaffolding protein